MESVTLELVEEAFCVWRAQRSSQSEPIPDKLWAMALALYPEYKRSKICEQLRRCCINRGHCFNLQQDSQ